jgi:putative peptidoglycan lipid II flippase
LTIPAAAATVLLGEPIVAFLLQGGAFDASATQLVYSILIVFSIRIVSEATLEIVARLFYARHNTRTPMWAYLGWLVVTVIAAYLFVGRLGIVGLALASTVGFTLLATALFILNHRELHGLHDRRLLVTAARALSATLAMSAVIFVVGELVGGMIPLLIIGGLAGAATYLLVHWILGGRELVVFFRLAFSPAA